MIIPLNSAIRSVHCCSVFVILFLLVSYNNTVAAEDDLGSITVSTGFDYSSGDYGTDVDTEIWYVPLTLKYENMPFTAKLTVPYIRITGAGGAVGGGGGVTVVGKSTSTKRTTESGLGDVIASFGYSIDPPSSAFPYIDLIGKIKFPTGDDERGLGTGEFDYTLQVDLAKSFGQFTPIATLGYTFKGDPAGLDLNNVFFASGGTAYRFNKQFSAGLTLDFQEASSDSADDAIELFTYVTWKAFEELYLTGYGVVGFTDGSPDEEVGLQIGYRFDPAF